MVLGLKPMGKPSTKILIIKVLDRTRALYGPRTQAYGETKYKNFNYYKFWTEPRPCKVLGPKPVGKPSTKFFFIITSFGQNQGLVWSSDSSLWGNQVQKFLLLQVLVRTKALYVPRTQAYEETKYKNFYYYKFWTEPRRCTFLGPKPTGKPTTRIRKGLNFARWVT